MKNPKIGMTMHSLERLNNLTFEGESREENVISSFPNTTVITSISEFATFNIDIILRKLGGRRCGIFIIFVLFYYLFCSISKLADSDDLPLSQQVGINISR